MGNIKVAFFDIDGTLASNTIQSHRIIDRVPDSAKESIHKLKEKGIIPIIATGRGRVIIQPFVDALGVDTYIASNGLSLTYQGEEIESSYLSNEQVESVINHVLSIDDVTVLLETTQGLVLVKSADNPAFRSSLHIYDITEDCSQAIQYQIYQVIVDGLNIHNKLQLDIPGLKARIVGDNAMDIYPENMSKAVGIKRMLELLSLTKENAIAFGDEENDVEMMQSVGTSVAMGNGNPMIQELATYVTDTVDNDGIYKACIHYQLFK